MTEKTDTRSKQYPVIIALRQLYERAKAAGHDPEFLGALHNPKAVPGSGNSLWHYAYRCDRCARIGWVKQLPATPNALMACNPPETLIITGGELSVEECIPNL